MAASLLTTRLISRYVKYFHVFLHAAGPVLRQFTRQQQMDLLRTVLLHQPKLELDTQFFTLFGLKLPLYCFAVHNTGVLQCLQQLIAMQTKRGTLFNERISQVYTMHFTNFAFDPHIETIVDRAQLATAVIWFFNIDHVAARQFVLNLRDNNSDQPALIAHMNVLLE